MKISEKFPLLKKEDALVVVSGAKTAKIYQIADGYLLEDEIIEVHSPKYFDREGFSLRREGDRLLSSGSFTKTRNSMNLPSFQNFSPKS